LLEKYPYTSRRGLAFSPSLIVESIGFVLFTLCTSTSSSSGPSLRYRHTHLDSLKDCKIDLFANNYGRDGIPLTSLSLLLVTLNPNFQRPILPAGSWDRGIRNGPWRSSINTSLSSWPNPSMTRSPPPFPPTLDSSLGLQLRRQLRRLTRRQFHKRMIHLK
jgi:hypothetical protein